MAARARFALAILTIVCLFACSGPTEPDHQSFIYPLAVGNQWVYDYTEISVYSDSTPTDTIQYTLTATVTAADTILPGIVVYVIQESGTDPWGYDFKGFKSYVNLADGMYLYYYSEPSPQIVLPKVSPRAANRIMPLPDETPSFGLRGFGSLSAMTGVDPRVVYADPARMVLPYPQKTGRRWMYLESSDAGFSIEKVIVGYDKVTTPAGTFDCLAIDWDYTPPLTDVEFSSRIAAQGVVLRTMDAYDINVTTYAFPYGTGETKDIHSRYELVSVRLD